MKEELKFINGECGEQISVSTARINPEGGKEHESIIVELDCISKNSNGDFCVILSPYMAKTLAEEIIKLADNAYEVNYHLLVDKAPF